MRYIFSLFNLLLVTGLLGQIEESTAERKKIEVPQIEMHSTRLVHHTFIWNVPMSYGLPFTRVAEYFDILYKRTCRKCIIINGHGYYPVAIPIKLFSNLPIPLIGSEIDFSRYELTRANVADEGAIKTNLWRDGEGRVHFAKNNGRLLSEGEIESRYTNIDIYSLEALRYHNGLLANLQIGSK